MKEPKCRVVYDLKRHEAEIERLEEDEDEAEEAKVETQKFLQELYGDE